MAMALGDLPGWVPAWCVDQLGAEPISVLFERRSISAVVGLAAHNARWEALHGDPPVSGDALRDQAAERLRRANA